MIDINEVAELFDKADENTKLYVERLLKCSQQNLGEQDQNLQTVRQIPDSVPFVQFPCQ